MKVCIITNLYQPYDRGGAEQVVKASVKGLLEAGHEVIILTASPKGDEYEEHGNLRIYRRKPANLFFYTDAHRHSFLTRALWHIIDMFHIGSARWVEDIIKKELPDVVHTHNLMGFGFLIPRAIRRQKVRHVHTVHDVQLVEPSGIILKTQAHSWRYNGLPTKIYTAIMKRLMGSPDIVIASTQFLLDFYLERGFFVSSKTSVIRNPIPLVPEIREKKTYSESLNCLYLGQIESHKGIEILMDAFSQISKNDITLDIVGAGTLLDNVQSITEKKHNITIHGKIPQEQIPTRFMQADLLIVPSLCYENSPTVIRLAHAFGVPVLASDVEGIIEIIDEGKTGITFETGNSDALTKKLQWCREHLKKVEEMHNYLVDDPAKEPLYIPILEELYMN